LPQRLDHKVPGILKFSLERGAELELFGSLRSIFEHAERAEGHGVVQFSITEQALELSGRYPRLHGEANGKPYTLVDCFSVHREWGISSGRESEVIHVNRIMRGAIFDQDGVLEGSGISFAVTYLTNWILETGIKERHSWREDGQPLGEEDPRYTLEAFEKPDRSVTTIDGKTVSLKHRVGIEGNRISQRSITQGFHFHIDSAAHKVPIDSLLDWAGDLQDLVSICSLKTAGFEFVRLWHPDVQRHLPDGPAIPTPIDLFAQWNAKSDQPPAAIHKGDLLFTFEDFGGIQGIRRWMDVAERHRSSLGRVTATRYARSMFVSDRLLNCAAALEGLDRTITGYTNSTFKTRLGRCHSLAGEPFVTLVGDVALWAEAIRYERDDIAHHFGRRARSSNIDTLYLWQSLYFLYVFCLFRLCDTPGDAFNVMKQHPEYVRLSRQIRSLIQGGA
jgi:hypothetical protein